MSMRTVMLYTLWAAGAVLAAGCGGGTTDHAIDTSRYSKACAGDADCVAVYQGQLGCCGGGCPNTAIASTTYAQYIQDVQANTPVCNPQPPCAVTPGACGDIAALCVGGRCTAATTSTSTLSLSPSRD